MLQTLPIMLSSIFCLLCLILCFLDMVHHMDYAAKNCQLIHNFAKNDHDRNEIVTKVAS